MKLIIFNKKKIERRGGILLVALMILFIGTMGVMMWLNLIKTRIYISDNILAQARNMVTILNAKESGKSFYTAMTPHFSDEPIFRYKRYSFAAGLVLSPRMSSFCVGKRVPSPRHLDYFNNIFLKGSGNSFNEWGTTYTGEKGSNSIIQENVLKTFDTSINYFSWAPSKINTSYLDSYILDINNNRHDFKYFIKSINPILSGYPIVLLHSNASPKIKNLGSIDMDNSLGVISTSVLSQLGLKNDNKILTYNKSHSVTNTSNIYNYSMPLMMAGTNLKPNLRTTTILSEPKTLVPFPQIQNATKVNPGKLNMITGFHVREKRFKSNNNSFINFFDDVKEELQTGTTHIKNLSPNGTSLPSVETHIEKSILSTNGYVDGQYLIGVFDTIIPAINLIDISGVSTKWAMGQKLISYNEPMINGFDILDITPSSSLFTEFRVSSEPFASSFEYVDPPYGHIFVEMANRMLPDRIIIQDFVTEMYIYEYLPGNHNMYTLGTTYDDNDPPTYGTSGELIYPDNSMDYDPSENTPVVMYFTEKNFDRVKKKGQNHISIFFKNHPENTDPIGNRRPLIILAKVATPSATSGTQDFKLSLNFEPLNNNDYWRLILITENVEIDIKNDTTIKGGIITDSNINLNGMNLKIIKEDGEAEGYTAVDDIVKNLDSILPRLYWVESYYTGKTEKFK